MKVQEKCLGCGKTFWAKAKKNKATGKIESLDNICQACKNHIRQKDQKKNALIRAIPKGITEADLRQRDLVLAELERRRKESEKNAPKGQEPTARIPG